MSARTPYRRPFAPPSAPEPFHRTPEFKRFAMLGGAMLLFGLILLGYYVYLNLNSSKLSVREQRPASGTTPDAPLENDGAAAAPAPLPALGLSADEQEVRLSTLFEGALRDTENGQDFRETEGYRKLLSLTANATDSDTVASRAYDFVAAAAAPDLWRGEKVHLNAIVGDIWAERLADPLLGRRDVWRMIATNGEYIDDSEPAKPSSTSLGAVVFIDFLDRPNFDPEHEAVDIEAVFYRTVRYESQTPDPTAELTAADKLEGRTSKGKYREAPYLIGYTAKILPTGVEGGLKRVFSTYAVPILALIAFVIFGGQLVAFWIQRRRKKLGIRRERVEPQSIREMFDQRLREQGIEPPSSSGPPRH
jgi:hypothetical protein